MSKMKTRSDWETLASTITWQNNAFIAGGFVDASDGRRFDCVSPLNGAVLTSIADCSQADVDNAVAAARAAFDSGVWSQTTPQHRKKVLLKLASLIEEHADELAVTETLDMGKPIRFARTVDLPLAVDFMSWFAESADKVYGEIVPTAPNVQATVGREPVGVFGAIVPWNFPLMNAAAKIAPALAAGNSVILKPAEQASLTALKLAELASTAGIPPGVFNVIPGSGAVVGQAIGRHMGVDAVSFTGSTAIGKMFMRYAADSNLKLLTLECGGKSPQIVLADVPDIDIAAKTIAYGAFFNQGEVCTAGTRLLVQKEIRGPLLERITAIASRMLPGDPLEPSTIIGALVDRRHTDRVLTHIGDAQKEGARLVLGGGRSREDSGGCFVGPAIFDEVRPDMAIAQEEVFGPVLAVTEVQTIKQAIDIANDSAYGLAAGVWTRDVSAAHYISSKLRVGRVWINCYDETSPAVPFGGMKQSGIGREGSLHAFEGCTQLKTTWLRIAPPKELNV